MNEDEQIKDIIDLQTDDKMKEIMQFEEDREYYAQLHALDNRISGSQMMSLAPKSIYANEGNVQFKAIENGRSSLIKSVKKTGKENHLFNNQLRTSRSIGSLQSNFGDLAALRKSRLLLNKHLEERARDIHGTEKVRKDQHEEFHRAVKDTGYQLDNLTRKMQYDMYRGSNRSILPTHADNATSMIEHELRKSKLLADPNIVGQTRPNN